MNPDHCISVTPILASDDDPWSTFTRLNEHVDEERLSQTSSSVTTSTGSSPADAFSSHEPTVITKPTSNGTNYHGYNYMHRDKTDVTYATSLSASHGSASDEDIEHDDALHDTLLYMGEWSSSQRTQDRCLRKRENAKVRLSRTLPDRVKKPPIDLHQNGQHSTSVDRETVLPIETSPALNESGMNFSSHMKRIGSDVYSGSRCLLHRVPVHHYLMFGLIFFMFSTAIVCGMVFYYADGEDKVMRKLILIASTLLVSVETVVVVLVAGHPLLDASTLGLFPLLTGFMLLLHLDFFN